jgi:hypothetical protein
MEKIAEADPNNLLGFNHREARLAERVREMEEQNQLLRRQLSFSQSQLISAMSENRRNDSTAVQDVITSYGSNGGGEEKSIVKCPSKVQFNSIFTFSGHDKKILTENCVRNFESANMEFLSG